MILARFFFVLWLFACAAWAGSFLNVSYNGPVNQSDVKLGFILEQPATVLISAESIPGTGGAGIPDPILELFDVSDDTELIFNDDCDSNIELYLGRALATAHDACAVVTLDSGLYAVRVGDREGNSGNVLVSILEIQLSNESSAQAILKWDPSSSSNIKGYRLYYGLNSGNYSSVINVGRQNTYTAIGLTPARRYFFAVTAYAEPNLESAFSNEVSKILQ